MAIARELHDVSAEELHNCFHMSWSPANHQGPNHIAAVGVLDQALKLFAWLQQDVHQVSGCCAAAFNEALEHAAGVNV
eukprot:Skav210407  [mRNA]  locus=scaffold1416:322871:325731:+ [translate_table: standard]